MHLVSVTSSSRRGHSQRQMCAVHPVDLCAIRARSRRSVVYLQIVMSHALDCEVTLELCSNRRSVQLRDPSDSPYRLFNCVHDEAGRAILQDFGDRAEKR